jgi:type I protein arginine methyltransferase
MLTFLSQEEELYEINIPLSFVASVGTRVHGLACWFDVLFNGRSVYLSIYWKLC